MDCWPLLHLAGAAVGSVEELRRGLGLRGTSVSWLGQLGTRWAQPLPSVQSALQREGRLDAVVIHLGSYDLRCVGRKDLGTIVPGLMAVARLCHPVDILWSEIIARPEWRGAQDHRRLKDAGGS
ncbi:hypothetical protein NDU88_007552 [Pleurodeles waltl]|uniref:Uncharacterized protein n=1 Tax=Pleurodeles waltl TaxID=8319 RepID=A0AAV7WHF1_PLEWA|nr:hypothetical protein NDU88_007552 [Pleurodeles waltl]